MIYAAQFLTFARDGLGRSPSTVRVYDNALRTFEKVTRIDDPAKITLASVDLWMVDMGVNGLSAETRRVRATSLKVFLSYLYARGLVTSNVAATVELPKTTPGPAKTFSPDEAMRLIFAAIPALGEPNPKIRLGMIRLQHRLHTLAHVRDSALIGVGFGCGLRSQELRTIKLDDLTIHQDGTGTLTVVGKGSQARRLAVDQKIGRLIEAWTSERRKAGVRSDWLFPSLADTSRPLSYAGTVEALRRRLRVAGIRARGRTLHDIRRTAITTIYESTGDLLKASRFAGHSTSATTDRYCRQSAGADFSVVTLWPWNAPTLP